MKTLFIIHIQPGYYLTDGYKAIKLVANDFYAALDDAKHKARQWKELATIQARIETDGYAVTLRYRVTIKSLREDA